MNREKNYKTITRRIERILLFLHLHFLSIQLPPTSTVYETMLAGG